MGARHARAAVAGGDLPLMPGDVMTEIRARLDFAARGRLRRTCRQLRDADAAFPLLPRHWLPVVHAMPHHALVATVDALHQLGLARDAARLKRASLHDATRFDTVQVQWTRRRFARWPLLSPRAIETRRLAINVWLDARGVTCHGQCTLPTGTFSYQVRQPCGSGKLAVALDFTLGLQ